MRRGVGIGLFIGLFIGLALMIALIAYRGFSAVGQSVWQVGWGILAITAFRAAPMIADAVAWRAVLGSDLPIRMRSLIVYRWIRDSVNILLPVAQVGGDVVGARLLMFRGAPGGLASASVLVGKTLEVLAQFVFTLAGLLVLIYLENSNDVVENVALGLLVMVPALVGFLVAQWMGLGKVIEFLARNASQKFGGTGDALSGLHDKVVEIYRNWRRTLPAFLLHLLGSILGAIEVWLILRFMDVPVTLVEAFVIESLGQAVRSAAFAIPASLGVQEAGYMIVGTLVGLPPEKGLALSLVKRLRHLLVGLPALLIWQGAEGRRLANRRAYREPAVDG